MHFTQLFTLTVVLAAGAFAAPNPPTKPSQPPKPTETSINQQNQCGNNVTPYCCTSDGKFSYTSCYAISKLLLWNFAGSCCTIR